MNSLQGNGYVNVDFVGTPPPQANIEGRVVITNAGTARTSWSVRSTFPTGQLVTQGWSANFAQAGGATTATNVSCNAVVAPDGTVIFGFLGSWVGRNPPATVVSCT